MPQYIHQFITHVLNMATLPVWIEIYEYVIQDIMIESVKRWRIESNLTVSSIVGDSEKGTIADVFQL